MPCRFWFDIGKSAGCTFSFDVLRNQAPGSPRRPASGSCRRRAIGYRAVVGGFARVCGNNFTPALPRRNTRGGNRAKKAHQQTPSSRTCACTRTCGAARAGLPRGPSPASSERAGGRIVGRRPLSMSQKGYYANPGLTAGHALVPTSCHMTRCWNQVEKVPQGHKLLTWGYRQFGFQAVLSGRFSEQKSCHMARSRHDLKYDPGTTLSTIPARSPARSPGACGPRPHALVPFALAGSASWMPCERLLRSRCLPDGESGHTLKG